MRGKHEECEEWEGEMPPGLAPSVAVSIVVGVGWLVFLILFFAFYVEGFSFWQNFAVILSSILVMGALLGSIWVYWGIKIGRKWKKIGREWKKRPRKRRRR